MQLAFCAPMAESIRGSEPPTGPSAGTTPEPEPRVSEGSEEAPESNSRPSSRLRVSATPPSQAEAPPTVRPSGPWVFAGWGHADRIADLEETQPRAESHVAPQDRLGVWRATAICG